MRDAACERWSSGDTEQRSPLSCPAQPLTCVWARAQGTLNRQMASCTGPSLSLRIGMRPGKVSSQQNKAWDHLASELTSDMLPMTEPTSHAAPQPALPHRSTSVPPKVAAAKQLWQTDAGSADIDWLVGPDMCQSLQPT